MVFTILWKRQSRAAAILSPILGLGTGLGVWLGTAARFGGAVSVATTGEVLPCVYGTVASCFSPILYSALITLLQPQNYDWADFKKEKLALEKLEDDLTTAHHDESVDQSGANSVEDGGLRSAAFDAKELKRWGRIAAFWSAATFLGHWVIWPLPMYGSGYVFEKKVSLVPVALLRLKSNRADSILVLRCLGCSWHYLAVGNYAGCDLLSNLRWWIPAAPPGLQGAYWPNGSGVQRAQRQGQWGCDSILTFCWVSRS